ncbi:MAG: hypothetical protein ACYC2K_17945, partial [Gemmatimonadales bacterium]
MSFACLWTPHWPTGAASSTDLVQRALRIAPRVMVEPERNRLWADIRSLDALTMGRKLLAAAYRTGLTDSRVGTAATPIAAEVAARCGAGHAMTRADLPGLTLVPPGSDRSFLALFPVAALMPDGALASLLDGVGIERCADLAALDLQAVEVRLGIDGVRLWRLARADDPRLIFSARRSRHPSAELEWVDYELAAEAQALFVVNGLLVSVCDELTRRSEGAHLMELTFHLADRTRVTLPIRCSSPTADRATWARVTRATLEPLTLAAAITRIVLEVKAAVAVGHRQGDLFDAGFATARSADTALAHLLDKQGDAVVTPRRTEHPLPERRVAWVPDLSGHVAEPQDVTLSETIAPRLTLQQPTAMQRVEVTTTTRREALIPTGYRDNRLYHEFATTVGPDRVSGGFGTERFER